MFYFTHNKHKHKMNIRKTNLIKYSRGYTMITCLIKHTHTGDGDS